MIRATVPADSFIRTNKLTLTRVNVQFVHDHEGQEATN